MSSAAHHCLACGRQTSVTAGTVLHRTKLPLVLWFWAAHLMATHSNGISARQLQAQLHVTYKTAWLLMQKLRRAMIDPDREPLQGAVEVDQTELPFRTRNSFFDPTAARSACLLVPRSREATRRAAERRGGGAMKNVFASRRFDRASSP
jgi:hypothetical protein